MTQKVRNKEKYDKLNIFERRGKGFVEFRHYNTEVYILESGKTLPKSHSITTS